MKSLGTTLIAVISIALFYRVLEAGQLLGQASYIGLFLAGFAALNTVLVYVEALSRGELDLPAKWWLSVPFSISGKLLAYPLAPFIALGSALIGGNTVYGPFALWMTHDNEFDVYQGEGHVDHNWGVERSFIDRFRKRARWMWRNKFYTGNAVLLGVMPVYERQLELEFGDAMIYKFTSMDGQQYEGSIRRFEILGVKFRSKLGYAPRIGTRCDIWCTISLGW